MDKSKLFENRLPTAEYELEGFGTLKFRSLTRDEAIKIGEVDDIGDRERKMLAWAMVDPKLSYQDAQKWQNASPPNEIESVTEAIARVSGLLEESAKEATKSDTD